MREMHTRCEKEEEEEEGGERESMSEVDKDVVMCFQKIFSFV